MTEHRPGYRLTQRLEASTPTVWATSTVEGCSLAAVEQFAVEWLALERQEQAVRQDKDRLCAQAEATGVPVPTMLAALRHLRAARGLTTSPDVLAAVLAVVAPLMEEEP